MTTATTSAALDTDVMDIAALMLRFPDEDIVAARPAIAEAAAGLAPGPARDLLAPAAASWAAADPDDLRAEYVRTFDLSRRTSLDLTYVTYGDRRQRGLALLALRRRYQGAGFEPDDTELADFLPMALEFAATGHPDGVAMLQDHRPVVELLHAALVEAGSRYAPVVGAVTACLPDITAEEVALVRALAKEGPPVESVGLEPFAPPEVMPDPVRRTACAGATTGGER